MGIKIMFFFVEKWSVYSVQQFLVFNLAEKKPLATFNAQIYITNLLRYSVVKKL